MPRSKLAIPGAQCHARKIERHVTMICASTACASDAKLETKTKPQVLTQTQYSTSTQLLVHVKHKPIREAISKQCRNDHAVQKRTMLVYTSCALDENYHGTIEYIQTPHSSFAAMQYMNSTNIVQRALP